MKYLQFLLAGFLLMGYTAQASNTEDSYLFNDSTDKETPENWHHLDPKESSYPGISSIKAHKELLKGKSSQTVVVAVIDSGIDIDHDDLKGVIWVNEDEIAGNGKDDDNNGYVDDVHGWNFIGGAEENVEFDTYELTREYKRLLSKYANMNEADKKADEEYAYFEKIEREYKNTVSKMETQYQGFSQFYNSFTYAKKLMQGYLQMDTITEEEVRAVESTDERVRLAQQILETAYTNGLTDADLEEGQEYFTTALNYGYSLDYDPRSMIGDNYADVKEKDYGNNDVEGSFAFHGTHVAGIIGAQRENNIGMDGIANNVQIMVLRAVPNGDERDKDVANAIIYAVNNGAQVINMSFGKRFSPDKSAVDQAVKYAEQRNVLLVHAAGNSADNNDVKQQYPTHKYSGQGGEASNWIEVGAATWKGAEELPASFSNYGKTSVDIFAPGFDIYSTAPDESYKKASGTSMAAPVTSGVAALLLSYFPHLTAQQVKEIIVKSAVSYKNTEVELPGEADKKVKFGELSKTGGVINAYQAVKLAKKYKQPKQKLNRAY
ncbi:MAG: S8 family peptidase [Cyclobacteriaceae bacterium]